MTDHTIKIHKLNRIPFLFLMLLFSGIAHYVQAQAVVSAVTDPLTVNPGDEFTVTFSVDSPVDAFFFASRVSYNPGNFEFLGLEAAGILLDTNTLTFSNDYSSGETGISITRTTPLVSPQSGELALIRFRVKPLAGAGTSSVNFSEVQLSDSQGIDLDITPPAAADATVNVEIGDLTLDMPASITIQDGESFDAVGRVFVSTLTDTGLDESPAGLSVWVGLNPADTDPSTWSEDTWQEMEFDAEDPDGFARFRRDIGFMQERGDFYVAVRAQLDGGAFFYGGRSDNGGGIWDGAVNVSAFFSITEPDAFRYTIVNWDFDNDNDLPSVAVPVNSLSEIGLAGASRNGFSSGGANSRNWNEEAGVEKFWFIKISTRNFTEIKLSSRQNSSGTGPKDFQLQASTDSLTWTDIPGGTVELVSSTASGVIDTVNLSPAFDDLDELYIRWLNTSPFAINTDDSTGAHNLTGTSGTSRIDDILITGINLNRQETEIWPGDTDDNGSVAADDVLPLGINWQQRGPKPIFPSFDWAPRRVEKWVTDTPGNIITASDANGDGIVSERDLQVIGLNFGESRSLPPSGGVAGNQAANKAFKIDPLEAGDLFRLIVSADRHTELLGSSFSVNLIGVSKEFWEISAIEPLSWAEGWIENNKLLEFRHIDKDSGEVSGAFVHKGITGDQTGIDLIAFEVRATRSWEEAMHVRLMNASVINSEGVKTRLDDAVLKPVNTVSVEDPMVGLPRETRLLSNYPNPFNPSTIIRYELSEPANVNLTVYDVIGRKVAVLVNNRQTAAGRHEIRFDAGGLASGLYLYRLQTDNFVQARQMMLIK